KIVDAVDTSSPTYLMIIIVIGVTYLYLLKRESSWNALLMMRDIIYGWIGIPALSHGVFAQIHDGLRVPDDGVAKVIRAWPRVTAQDFSKGKNTFDRKWAEVCYMRSWLEEKQASKGDATFFAEESFNFNKTLEQFGKDAAEAAKVEHEGVPALVARVVDLHKKLARLVACYLIHQSGGRKRLIAEASDFGIILQSPTQENPLAYSIVYIITLIACAYVGVYLSAVVFDWAYVGDTLLESISHQGGANIDAWIIYAAGNYGFTIILILSLRTGARAVGIGT